MNWERPISSRPVQTEVDLEPSPPELVWGASVNQSMKLRLLHTSSIVCRIETTEESERVFMVEALKMNNGYLNSTDLATFLYYN
ncbi:unnamed protein product [Bursaphelenchus xylophilus]|uniref:(pine wood nematode) hypothetical protein n=1 Tax=Bursaphelenchus xylophilus TaxID=6326 RepID=A0A7I8XNW2_BURXY|nr:unnamed protein product [Bursaphelenchus xylophilus]CAG9089195.1 unnamed protein product [Bursaphelenchus xylophilus]